MGGSFPSVLIDKILSLEKIIEIIYELAFCAEVPITIVFWTLLFKYVLDTPDVTGIPDIYLSWTNLPPKQFARSPTALPLS
jgi:hypothetical protein